ncbi:hypothetical protein [uncultured Bosea sp.]|uniref:hypothetical protein n=1 Tax=uncultured Bosea sp. TaxID=211457 RepID=UPI0025CD33A5|nr:hypothetical protein [uncultured Bosea sp.]
MTNRTRSAATALLLLAGTALGAATVFAQVRGGLAYDTSQLPQTKGVVKQYTLGPRGEIDGLLLGDGTEVKLPPHLSTQTAFALRPGDAVTVRGLKARALPLIDAVSVTNDATGAVVLDQGGPEERSAVTEVITGKIVAVLHGKRGEVNGAVLDNGAQLRLPPHEAERFADLLKQDQTISLRGESTKSALGTVIEATALGATPDRLAQLDARRPKPPRPDDRAPPPPPPGPRG